MHDASPPPRDGTSEALPEPARPIPNAPAVPAARIGPLLNLRINRDTLWHPDDYGGLLDHLLSAPLSQAMWTLESQDLQSIERALITHSPPIISLSQLLAASDPPFSALIWLKNVAKSERINACSLLPEPVAIALYFACISTSIVTRVGPISRLEPLKLREGIGWLINQPWIRQSIVDRARSALAMLSSQCPFEFTS